MKTKLKLLALAMLAATSIASQAAGTATATMNVTLNVAGLCSFSASNYSVNVSGLVNSKPQQATNITYTCAAGLAPTLEASAQTASDGAGNTIGVDIFSDSGYTNSIDGNPMSLVANGSATTVPLYLQFQTTGNGNLVTPGTFNFAIPLTINY